MRKRKKTATGVAQHPGGAHTGTRASSRQAAQPGCRLCPSDPKQNHNSRSPGGSSVCANESFVSSLWFGGEAAEPLLEREYWCSRSCSPAPRPGAPPGQDTEPLVGPNPPSNEGNLCPIWQQ